MKVVRAQVEEYARGVVRAVRRGQLPAPSEKQCKLCEEHGKGYSRHLAGHVEHGEYVPVVLWRSLCAGEFGLIGLVVQAWRGKKVGDDEDWAKVRKGLEGYLVQALGKWIEGARDRAGAA